MPKSVILDVDTGVDDAFALLYAVRHPDLKVLGITCVDGNTHLDQVCTNTLYVIDAAGAGDDCAVAPCSTFSICCRAGRARR